MSEWVNKIKGLLEGDHSTSSDELNAGAQLVVTEPDGTEVLRAALARHFRLDPDEAHLIWVRPITSGDVDPTTGEPVFNLNVCRRRALAWTEVRVAGGAVLLTLEGSQLARIEPAGGKELAELHSWDDFILGLSASEEKDLDDLESDSWWGRFS